MSWIATRTSRPAHACAAVRMTCRPSRSQTIQTVTSIGGLAGICLPLAGMGRALRIACWWCLWTSGPNTCWPRRYAPRSSLMSNKCTSPLDRTRRRPAARSVPHAATRRRWPRLSGSRCSSVLAMPRCRRCGEMDPEGSARSTALARGRQRSAVCLDDRTRDGQTDPAARRGAGSGRVSPVEPLEEPFRVGRVEAFARVDDRQRGARGFCFHDHAHRPTGGRVAQRVVEQVREGFGEPLAVDEHDRCVFDDVDVQAPASGRVPGAGRSHCLGCERREVPRQSPS